MNFLSILDIKPDINHSSSLINRMSPSNKNSPFKSKQEYLKSFAKKMNENQFYKLTNSPKIKNLEEEQFISQTLRPLHSYISYHGIEVSTMKIRPQTKARYREIIKKKTTKAPDTDKIISRKVSSQQTNRIPSRKIIYQNERTQEGNDKHEVNNDLHVSPKAIQVYCSLAKFTG